MTSTHAPEERTIERLVRLISILLIFILLTRTPVDADLWWHLRAGQTMIEQGQILLTDVFGYTRPGVTWVNAFWVSEILLAALYSLGGYFALTMFVSFTGAATFYLLSRRLNGNPFINGFTLILAATAAAPIWGPRPQILSFFIVALLDTWLVNKRPHWWLPILFAVWANIHGGWIWGYLLIAAHIAGNLISLFLQADARTEIWRETRSLLSWSALSALAIGLNPNGIAIWALPFQQVNVSMQIQEWLSPDFHGIDFHPFLWTLFLLLFLSPFAPKPPAWGQIIKILGFSYLTFVAQRNVAIAAIVAAPLLADWMNAALQHLMKDSRPSPRRSLPLTLRTFINAALGFTLLAAALGNAYLASLPEKVDENYPTAAIQWIKTNQPEGQMFNSYNWGGYLLWTLPEYPVFIDGRADMYDEELIQQWQNVVSAEANALSILDEWNVNFILLEPHWSIVTVLQTHGWQTAFEDDKAVILVRK
ncbi:MAG TPA: hypothetical protein PLV64_20715 [Anaerolineales bacterium]|nr:hypothetical protein [Anaerolineales bacterium]